MQINLENKLAIVTGSIAGIGFAIVKGLAAAVAHVVLNGRTQARVDEAITRLEREINSIRTTNIRGVAADLSRPGRVGRREQFVMDLGRDGNKTHKQGEQEFFANMRRTSLIKRFETVEEIANVCVFLASNQASAVTGTAARVDGGVVRSVI